MEVSNLGRFLVGTFFENSELNFLKILRLLNLLTRLIEVSLTENSKYQRMTARQTMFHSLRLVRCRDHQTQHGNKLTQNNHEHHETQHVRKIQQRDTNTIKEQSPNDEGEDEGQHQVKNENQQFRHGMSLNRHNELVHTG